MGLSELPDQRLQAPPSGAPSCAPTRSNGLCTKSSPSLHLNCGPSDLARSIRLDDLFLAGSGSGTNVSSSLRDTGRPVSRTSSRLRSGTKAISGYPARRHALACLSLSRCFCMADNKFAFALQSRHTISPSLSTFTSTYSGKFSISSSPSVDALGSAHRFWCDLPCACTCADFTSKGPTLQRTHRKRPCPVSSRPKSSTTTAFCGDPAGDATLPIALYLG
mmetsp:Transcript_24652/g.68750  ORF Transcript_24652/g.68750 Transcript_24652/m.68750 type:complete len:220 (-) Transcript_24652:44-703(-)